MIIDYKAPFVVYADYEWLIEKIDECEIDPENLTTTKAGEHILSGFSMSTISSFKNIENKPDVSRGKDWMETFCKSLRKHGMEIISFK